MRSRALKGDLRRNAIQTAYIRPRSGPAAIRCAKGRLRPAAASERSRAVPERHAIRDGRPPIQIAPRRSGTLAADLSRARRPESHAADLDRAAARIARWRPRTLERTRPRLAEPVSRVNGSPAAVPDRPAVWYAKSAP